MKKILFFVLLLNLVITNGCGDCDGERYQITVKKEIGQGYCEYKAQSISTCSIWNEQAFIIFVDACKEYSLSQVLDREFIVTKYK